jgi:hypothetical protein
MVAFSLLLTIPVECLVATTTWRRLYSKIFRRFDYEDEDGDYREVTCCDLIAITTATKVDSPNSGGSPLHLPASDPSLLLPSAEKVIDPSSLLNHDSSSDDDIEFPETSTNNINTISQATNLYHQPGVEDSMRVAPSSPGKQRRRKKRFRRNQSMRKSHGGNQELSGSDLHLSASYSASSGAWAFFRSILGNGIASRPVVENSSPKVAGDGSNLSPRTTIEDLRLSALRESFRDEDYHTANNSGRTSEIRDSSSTSPIKPQLSGSNRGSFANPARGSFQERTANGSPPSGERLPQNHSLTNTANITDGRASSLDQQIYGDILEEEIPKCPTRNEFIPTFMFWLCCLGLSSVIHSWMYIASTFSVISTILLMFIFPSYMYFRLGLLSDYQAKPLFGELLPNRAYMTIIKTIGIALLIFDILLMVCLIATKQNVIKREG